ncbi:alpha/beta hydrolase [Robiginitalea sp. SC105]|uniref:alpha/beta hydrolase n=1 Tax=Robiginitalea sp. SC105 TaxID=2762332 RepID=UPI001639F101|nr:esterase [Robiginitalea sp. SC105]MBC2840714.1 esterase [Robiginitalea sp. SC105]
MSEPDTPSSTQKAVSYTASQPYFTRGRRSADTQSTWMVFHGIGYLAPHFLKHFEHLDPDRHYLVAPQAPSLYYQTESYDRVGACWLTRKHTAMQMENLLGYLDQIAESEALSTAGRLVFFGYSQGVSIVCRWVAQRKISCDRIVLYAGKVPDDVSPRDFDHLPDTCRVELLYGDSDPLADKWDRSRLIGHARDVFGSRLKPISYAGGHELQRQWIRE